MFSAPPNGELQVNGPHLIATRGHATNAGARNHILHHCVPLSMLLLSTYLLKAHQQNFNFNIQNSFTNIYIHILYMIENKSADVQKAYRNGLLLYCTRFKVYKCNNIDIEFLC